MSINPYWDPLLENLRQLHILWLNKANVATDNKARLRGILFGIELGSNRILEELESPHPAIAAIITDWLRRLRQREDANAHEVVDGLDDGIRIVINCVQDFLKTAGTPKSSTPECQDGANGCGPEEV